MPIEYFVFACFHAFLDCLSLVGFILASFNCSLSLFHSVDCLWHCSSLLHLVGCIGYCLFASLISCFVPLAVYACMLHCLSLFVRLVAPVLCSLFVPCSIGCFSAVLHCLLHAWSIVELLCFLARSMLDRLL